MFDSGAVRIEARRAQNNVPALDVLSMVGVVQEGGRRNSVQRFDGVRQDRMVLPILPEDGASRRENLYKQIASKRA